MNWSSWSIWSPKQTGVRGGDQSRWSSGWVTIPSRRTLRSRHRPYSHYTSLHIVTIRAPTGEHGVCLFIFSSRLLPELRQASPVIPRSQLTIGTSRHRRMCKHHPEVWLLLWAHKFECDSYVWYMKHINIYTYIYIHLNLMKSENSGKRSLTILAHSTIQGRSTWFGESGTSGRFQCAGTSWFGVALLVATSCWWRNVGVWGRQLTKRERERHHSVGDTGTQYQSVRLLGMLLAV